MTVVKIYQFNKGLSAKQHSTRLTHFQVFVEKTLLAPLNQLVVKNPLRVDSALAVRILQPSHYPEGVEQFPHPVYINQQILFMALLNFDICYLGS